MCWKKFTSTSVAYKLIEPLHKACKWKHLHIFFVFKPSCIFVWGLVNMYSNILKMWKVSSISWRWRWMPPTFRLVVIAATLLSTTYWISLQTNRKSPLEVTCHWNGWIHSTSNSLLLATCIIKVLPPHWNLIVADMTSWDIQLFSQLVCVMKNMQFSRKRDRERETHTHTHKEREIYIERDTCTQSERDTERQRQREIGRDREDWQKEKKFQTSIFQGRRLSTHVYLNMSKLQYKEREKWAGWGGT